MSEGDQLLADLVVMRRLEMTLNRFPLPACATSTAWRIYMHQISERAETDVMVLTEDPIGPQLAACRRAIWSLEQRLLGLVDDSRWEGANKAPIAAAELARSLRAELLRRSFVEFARYFWPRMTGLPFPENTATRALCAALQAVADGRIWRLLVAIASGIGKSTMLALYSAWRVARRADWRAMHAMHASTDANRESIRVRRLVTHEDYQRLFPLQLAADEQSVQAWATTAGGRYFALGTDTAITSKRVLKLVVDDPMNAADRRSKTERDRVAVWLEESAMSRLDGDRAPVIIVAHLGVPLSLLQAALGHSDTATTAIYVRPESAHAAFDVRLSVATL